MAKFAFESLGTLSMTIVLTDNALGVDTNWNFGLFDGHCKKSSKLLLLFFFGLFLALCGFFLLLFSAMVDLLLYLLDISVFDNWVEYERNYERQTSQFCRKHHVINTYFWTLLLLFLFCVMD